MDQNYSHFTFQNQQNRAVELVIEPWALLEDIPSGGPVLFEVRAAPPPEIEFSVTEEGQAYVYVMSERVRIHVNGVLKHDLTSSFRPPISAFRVLRKLLWSN